VVSGPSGSGKTTIIRRLLERLGLEFSVSATTRQARSAEREGVDYYFMSRDEFRELIDGGGLLEWAVYNGNYYGTPAAPVDAAVGEGRRILLDIELVGARQVRTERPDALMIFIAPPSLEELEARLRSRGDTPEEEISGRLEIAPAQLAEATELFDHIVVNINLDEATEEVANLIIGRSSGSLGPSTPSKRYQ
jgi:guanylate kinase